MATINEATRMCKRIILSNLLSNDNSIAVTPLLSGRHGIGKSQVGKRIAEDIGGVCITVEGGTLKEGEITGIPYQYHNNEGEVEFRFLPYYAVKRIQDTEKALSTDKSTKKDLKNILEGLENCYSQEDLSFDDKVDLIKEGKVIPVVLFFDEINRTDVAVFRELMNIVLTRTVNGYRFPWWVFIIAAMNPSTRDSMYSTNEMDPAQMDRFIKIYVRANVTEWIDFSLSHNIDKTLIDFIANNPKALCGSAQFMEDDEAAKPSPRGWSMVDIIIKGKDCLDSFFEEEELIQKDDDIRSIISSKVGCEAATMYYSSLTDNSRLVLADDIFYDGSDDLSKEIQRLLRNQGTARNSITSKSVVAYLIENIEDISMKPRKLKRTQNKLSTFMSLLDNSSKLLFATSLVNVKEGALYDYVSDIFDDGLMDLLERGNLSERKVVG